MKVLLISHVMPGDATAAAPRVSWVLDDFARRGVRTHLLVLREKSVGRAAGARPIDSAATTVVTVGRRARPGYAASLLGRDGGFDEAIRRPPYVVDAVEKGLEIVRTFGPDAMLSTSVRIAVHEVACQLSERSDTPWVIDWLDPIALRPLRVWRSRRFHEALLGREREWIERAGLNIVTAPSYGRIFSDSYPGKAVKLVTMGWVARENGTGGSDAGKNDGGNGRPVRAGTLAYSGSTASTVYGFAPRFPPRVRRRAVHLLSAGRIYSTPFDGSVGYRALGRRALRAIARAGRRVRALVFRGGRIEDRLAECLDELGLSDRAEALPWITPAAAQADLGSAHVIWLSLAGTSRSGGEPVISSKVFGYLASGRPIFAVLPPDCDTAAVLRGQPGVFMPDPYDEDALVDALVEALSLPPEMTFERDVEHLSGERVAEEISRAVSGLATGASDTASRVPARTPLPPAHTGAAPAGTR